jgi:hypothetical protein
MHTGMQQNMFHTLMHVAIAFAAFAMEPAVKLQNKRQSAPGNPRAKFFLRVIRLGASASPCLACN